MHVEVGLDSFQDRGSTPLTSTIFQGTGRSLGGSRDAPASDQKRSPSVGSLVASIRSVLIRGMISPFSFA